MDDRSLEPEDSASLKRDPWSYDSPPTVTGTFGQVDESRKTSLQPSGRVAATNDVDEWPSRKQHLARRRRLADAP